ncbi:MAG TPA: SAM-dependent methyltransferase [Usitatibacteraceae bacterium]|nr:SAM-dependent methyltransferase [Usitatibacteraceae bacterium]
MIVPAALYLIPVPLVDDGVPADVLPAPVLGQVRAIRDFVVENAKSSRRFLSACDHPGPISDLGMAVLDEHTRPEDVPGLLAPLRAGRPLGVLSEAGAPAVADPGASLVSAAHAEGLRVVPLTGPSAILLALMASGLEGQRFRFAGYLPVAAGERASAIRDLESRSAAARETQAFIETPYRNDTLFADLLKTCGEDTWLTVAAGLTGGSESIRTATIREWRRKPGPPGRRPAIFLLLCGSGPARR